MTDSSLVSPPSGDGRLRVLDAFGEGWRAFCRAPLTFLGFILVVALFSIPGILLQLPLQLAAQSEASASIIPPLVTLILFVPLGLLGVLVNLVVNLWGAIGTFRGAWVALDGRKPEFSTFTRWDLKAVIRLFLSRLSLAVIYLILSILFLLSARFAASYSQPIQALSVVAGAAVLIYVAVTQRFLSQIALFSGPGAWTTIGVGRKGVDPQWLSVFFLVILEAFLFLLGMLLCFIGWVAVWPLVACVSTAAYRQIFGSEDRTGLLSP